MHKITLLLLTILLSTNVSAESFENARKKALDNISHEFVTCASFFAIVSNALVLSNESETAEVFKTASDKAFKYGLAAAENGRTKKMAEKVSLSRFELGLDEMRSKIDNDASNISILLVEHLQLCKDAISNPMTLIEKWESKRIEKN